MAKSKQELLDMTVKIACETIESINPITVGETTKVEAFNRVALYIETIYRKLDELNEEGRQK